MDSSPSDLTLDYTPNGNGTAAASGGYPKQASPVVDHRHHLTPEQATTQKLQEFLARLDDERLKIDAFKRELPLCMQLLNQAMEAYRQQLEACQMGSHGAAAARAPLVLEEFIPLKNIGIDEAEKAAGNAPSEKASWMVSAQLWNGPATGDAAAKGPQTPKERSEHPLDTSPMLGALDGGGGAFLPFSKEKACMAESAALPELGLAPAEKDREADRKPYHDAGGSNGTIVSRRDVGAPPTSTAPEGQSVPPAPQTNRKARRCWSPELHRRFVNALQILGGAQVATPKQIRELMKVDGLTNDEVKSHLQKYRLHTRRPMPAPSAPPAGAPQLVVLGGIWMPPDYAAQGAGPAAIYGAHPATQAHYTAAVSAQEYYQSAAAAAHHGHHMQHHPAASMVHHRAVAPPPPPPPPQHQPVYKVHPVSAAGSQGSSEGRRSSGGGRERSESIEEEGEEREEDDDDDNDDHGMAANGDAEQINY
ncbi:Two-component response regulator ARR18 [Hordeum vulgare]|nr:Two-component response regulator ARR18 [Hordeum vulgare]